jgi:hypothetical protein
MRRVVVVLKDAVSPLHYLRCQAPCAASPDGQWCMREWDTQKPLCYLGGGMSPEGARIIAERAGYEVAQ